MTHEIGAVEALDLHGLRNGAREDRHVETRTDDVHLDRRVGRRARLQRLPRPRQPPNVRPHRPGQRRHRRPVYSEAVPCPAGAVSANSASRSSAGGPPSRLTSVYMTGTTIRVNNVDVNRPPTTARASGTFISSPRNSPVAIGSRSRNVA